MEITVKSIVQFVVRRARRLRSTFWHYTNLVADEIHWWRTYLRDSEPAAAKGVTTGLAFTLFNLGLTASPVFDTKTAGIVQAIIIGLAGLQARRTRQAVYSPETVRKLGSE